MYLNVVQLAESFGVEESDVEGWVRNDGLPCVPDRGRLLFDRVQIVEWAARRGLAAKAGFLAPERAAATATFSAEALLRHGGIWRDLATNAVLPALETVVNKLPGATPAIRQLLVQRVRSTNGITWAPVGDGFALPHLRTPVALGRDAGTLALLMLREPLSLAEPPPDGVPITRLFFFAAPSPRAHLELLAQLSKALARGGLRQLVRDTAPDEQIFAALHPAEATAETKETNP